MAPMRWLLDALALALMVVGGVALVLMMLQIVGEAVMRTAFDSSLIGTMEIVSYYHMVAVTFLPLAYIQRERGHVIIELFTQGLPVRTVAAIDAMVCLAGAVAMAVFCYAAWGRAVHMTAIGEFVIGLTIIVTWPGRWLIVLGTGMLSFYFLVSAIEDALVALGRRKPPAEGGGHGGGHAAPAAETGSRGEKAK